MQKTPATREAIPVAAIGFRPEFLDFQRGIRVGNLEDNERITRILKLALESRYGQPFVTERWSRGVHWQWIGYLPLEPRGCTRSKKPSAQLGDRNDPDRDLATHSDGSIHLTGRDRAVRQADLGA